MKTHTFLGISLIVSLLALSAFGSAQGGTDKATSHEGLETATFAGGCFWCVEHAFDEVEGIVSTTSGYIGGRKKSPTYKEVSAGSTGHAEAVQVVYDPEKVSYEELLRIFWRNIDPTTPNKQFCDTGSQYRSAIFYHNEMQKRFAQESKRELEKSKPFKEPIVTEITMASDFYVAEDYHQDYHHKNPIRYKIYRYGCGRDRRLNELWGNTT
ncbi:MAG: peptide-methionine (S)-S-oxide reductase MsrA [Acidiferrobacterales bacterium]